MGCDASSTRGVSAPCSLLLEDGAEEPEGALDSSVGERERGVDILLATLDPRVAATDGDEGGSGERVK